MHRFAWKALIALSLSGLLISAQVIAQEQDDFQMGTVASVKKTGATSGSTTNTTGGQLQPGQYQYTVSVQVANMIYDLQVDSMTPDLQPFGEGQTVDIKVKGRTAQFKNSLGEVTDFPISGRHPAS